MARRETMIAYFENRKKHINVLRDEIAVFKVKNGGPYTNHQALKASL